MLVSLPRRSCCALALIASAAAGQARVQDRVPGPPASSERGVARELPEPYGALDTEGRVRAGLESARGPGLVPGLDELVFDEPGEGSVWVLGRNYKARVAARGLTYVPFFGSQAPRNFPVAYEVRSASIAGQNLPVWSDAQPIRDGARVYVLHGAVTEVLDFALDSVEQSFVVERGDRVGDLDLLLDVATELERGMHPGGFVFHNPLGAVTYGLPTTLDASGRQLSTTTDPTEAGMEFRVPAAEVARATGTITIDPIVATINIDSSLSDDREPDVAYDVSNDRYIVVYERIYSQNDHDVLGTMLQGATGQVIPNTWSYIDFTWDDWRQLSVGNMNGANQFLVAGSVAQQPGPQPEVIRCRTRAAATLTMGSQFTIGSGADGQCSLPPPQVVHHARAPVVGGDTWPGAGGLYCVAWVNHDIIPDHGYCESVFSVVVSSTGWSSAPQWLDNPHSTGGFLINDGTWPMLCISRSNGDSYSGASQDWNLAWRRENNSCTYNGGQSTVFGGDAIMAARIHWNGTVTSPPAVLVNPCVPSPHFLDFVATGIAVSTSESNSTRRFLLLWDAGSAGVNSRLDGVLVDPSVGWGNPPPSPGIHLTQLQGNPGTQWRPSVDFDGTGYVLAFNAYPGGITGLAAAEISWFYSKWYGAWDLGCSEPQTQIWISNQQMGRARICAEASGGGTRRNALIVGTNWGGYGSGGYYGGDPIAGLHAH